MMKSPVEIELGDIAMYNWEKGDPLYPSWYDEKDRSDIKENDLVLQPNTEYNLTITYPLSRDYEQAIFTKDEGMSREDFISLVILCYKQIYKDEEDTSEIEAGHIPGMYNRVITDGVYGIWGHDLSDLVLHTLYIDNNELKLGIDS